MQKQIKIEKVRLIVHHPEEDKEYIKVEPIEEEVKEPQDGKLLVLKEPRDAMSQRLKMLVKSGLSGKSGLHWDGHLWGLGVVATVNANGKYIFNIGGANTYPVLNVGGAPEFSALDAIYDEFFVKSMTMIYEPQNQLGGSIPATGAASDANNALAAWAGLQHNAGPYVDSSTFVANCLAARYHKVTNFGRRSSFVWKNVEKFAWDAPLGDQSTAGSSQTWCQNTLSAKYGGFVQFGSVIPTAAAASATALPTSLNLGHCIVDFHVCFRARA